MRLPVLGLDAEYINKRISAISVNLRQKQFILPKVYLFFWDKDKSWLISYETLHYCSDSEGAEKINSIQNICSLWCMNFVGVLVIVLMHSKSPALFSEMQHSHLTWEIHSVIALDK